MATTTPVLASTAYKKQIATIGSGHYDVTHYGATGDGATDDAVACQAALDAAKAAGGGTVYFPAGTYIVGLLSDNGQTHSTKIKGGLKIGDNTTVCGDGFSSILKVDADSYSNATWSKMGVFVNDDLAGGNSNITIRDLKLDGNQTNVVLAATEQELIDFVSVTNSLIENLYLTDSVQDTIDLDTCTDITINNIIVKNPVAEKANMYNGVHGGGTRISVTNSYFEYCGEARIAADDFFAAIDISAEGAKVSGNVIKNCARGVTMATGAVDSIISNNSITNCDRAGIKIISGASRTIVSNNAVNNVNIDASGDDDDQWCIYAEASNTTIANNILNFGSQKKGIKAITTTQGVTVTGNYVAASEFGIHINCAGSSQVTNNKIQGTCTVHAIECDGGATTVVANIIDGRPSNSARGAIDVNTNANFSVVSANIIKGDAAGMAVHIDADDCMVSSNYIEGTGAAPADISIKGADCVIFGNRCKEAATLGLLASATATNILVYGNNFTGCTAGVDVTTTPPTNPQVSPATGPAANINV